MRITRGLAGGRRLAVPRGLGVRPTPDLVKQALFNSLGARVLGASVLELFAGTGALSLESLSCGARQALCIEKSRAHAAFIRQNLERCQLDPARLEVRVQGVFEALPPLWASGRQFDLVLADPPYGEKNVGRRSTSLAQQLLDDPVLPHLLAPSGVLVLGHSKRDTLELPPAWTEQHRLRHGDSVLRFFILPLVFRADSGQT